MRLISAFFQILNAATMVCRTRPEFNRKITGDPRATSSAPALPRRPRTSRSLRPAILLVRAARVHVRGILCGGASLDSGALTAANGNGILAVCQPRKRSPSVALPFAAAGRSCCLTTLNGIWYFCRYSLICFNLQNVGRATIYTLLSTETRRFCSPLRPMRFLHHRAR